MARTRASETPRLYEEMQVMREVVRRSTEDPDWFCNNVLQQPNDVWQTEMLRAVADLDRARMGLPTFHNHELKNRFTIRAFHGPGKTHFIAKLMHWWNFTRKGRIVATAPKEKQLTTRLWPEFRKVKGRATEAYQPFTKIDKTAITWFNDPDWVAHAETASNADNLAGHHDEWLLYLVDEASGVSEDMFPAIEGTLSTTGAVLVMIGNPVRTTGEFYNSHNKPKTMDLYYRKGIDHSETTRIDPKWVESMIAKYGLQSPIVQSRVFGHFVDTEANQLLATQWVVDALERDPIDDGSHPKLRVTVDVADGGLDSTIVSVCHLYDSYRLFKKQHKFNFPAAVAPVKAAQAAQRIFEAEMATGQFYDGDLVVDSVGVGAGTAGTLALAGLPVIRYMGGAASDDTSLWRNRRTQSYLCYRDDLRDGKVVFADDYFDEDDEDDFLAQHASIKSIPGTERVEEIEPKERMKARGVKSPDMADAPAMSYATQAPLSDFGGTDIMATTDAITAESDW